MSKKSRKKLKQWKKRRKILKRETVQTKRSAQNDKDITGHQEHAQRMNNRNFYFKWKCRGE